MVAVLTHLLTRGRKLRKTLQNYISIFVSIQGYEKIKSSLNQKSSLIFRHPDKLEMIVHKYILYMREYENSISYEM